MPSHLTPGRRLRRVALAALLLSATPAAFAQNTAYPAGATVQYIPQPDDPGERLAGALRTLASNPNDLNALVAAGQNAVILGDPNAAVGFFGRAGSLAPRDGRVKAGLGSALVQLEKPQEALRLFSEAAALGVPVSDFAADRGLAYDLMGDGRRAQADYQAVLTAHPDDDGTRRRLALSQGIAGDRKTAIATLDPLIRKRDIAAWRAQTFVLAMTGDTAGANDITRIMLPQQQAALQPFLQRLATLSPSDKARAVHFGEMPTAGRAYSETQLANIGAPATYAPAPAALRPTPTPRTQIASAAPMRPAYQPVAQPRPAAVTTPLPSPAPSTASDLAPARTSPTPAGAGTATGYAAAPLAGIALSTAATPAATVTVAPQPATSPPSVVATTDVPASSPVPSVASGMPIGSTGTEGHFDLPHDSTVRRPVPRVAQPTARAPVIAPAPNPIRVADAPTRLESTPTPTVRVAEATAKPVDATSEPAIVTTPAPKPMRIAEATPKAPEPRPAVEKPPRPPATSIAKPDEPYTFDAVPAAKKGSAKTHARDEDTTSDTRRDRDTHATGKSVRGKTEKAETTVDEDRGTTKRGAHTASSDDDRTTSKSRSRSGAKDEDRATGKSKSRSDDEGGSARSRSHSKADADEDTGKRTSSASKSRSRAADTDEDSDRKGSSRKSPKKTDAAAPRVYVQVAGGANKADMDKAWDGVRKKAPDLMKGKTASTTPLKATNRLVVGPFKDEAEAQAFVNKAAGKGVSGFVVKTDKGQKVEKIDGGK